MNVTELARKLNITRDQLFEEIQNLGFDIGRRAIKVDDQVAKKVLKKLQGKVIRKKPKEEIETEEIKEEKKIVKKGETIELPPFIVIRELAELLNLPVTELMKELIKNGVMAAMNEPIDYETAAIIAEDLGYKTRLKEKKTTEETESEKDIQALLKDKRSKLKPRPPVVVVMGHVDHGKTLLLDAIRESNVVESETGGITQHIGAYQVKEKNKLITFIDTPGHEAFTAMRSRGAKVADVAILVVAADEGIKPQTIEAINAIQAANLPLIVAINKIDKPEADAERVKKDLSELNLLPEDWGGKTICVSVSAKEKKGINDLLEMILLVAEMEKEKIMANPHRPAVGTIIEAHVDKGEGPVTTVLIRTGTLHQGNLIKVGETPGKIKALKDFQGHLIKEAPPSTPVRILGLKKTPGVGDILEVIEDIKSLKKEIKKQKVKKVTVSKVQKGEPEKKKKKSLKTINLILKTDNLGSQEAILEALEKIKHEEIKPQTVWKGLGNITEKDVIQAETSQAIILGFHVVTHLQAQDLAREKGIEIKTFQIIYDLIDEVKKKMETQLEPEIIKVPLGKLKVLAIFRKESKAMIIGGGVTEGKIEKGTQAHVLRNQKTITTGFISQLQQEKKNVNEVKKGIQCGLKFEGEPLIEEGDILEIYREETKSRKLT